MSTGNKLHYLNPEHPNFERWNRSRRFAFERGKFVLSIIKKFKDDQNLKILDVGSGFGGTIQNFLGRGNTIYSIEIDNYKLGQQPENSSIRKFYVNAFDLPFDEKFDIIILQDFIEHIEKPAKFLKYIRDFLKDDGLIYLSTPNKFSLINIVSDPHWGFPLVSILSRKLIQKFFIPLFRRKEIGRSGIAELLSLNQLKKIFEQNRYNFQLHTKFAVKTLFENPEQIIWSNFHIEATKILKRLKLQKVIIQIANDNAGFVNKFLTSTFYITLTTQR